MSITLKSQPRPESTQAKNKTPRGQITQALLILACLGFLTVHPTQAEPPFSGTIFIDPDIITEKDPTTYLKMEDAGQGNREMYDRREGWVYRNAFLFDASFRDGPKVEIQVNPEFGNLTVARAEALKFAPVIGRLPRCLLEDLETVWIHKGNNPFGGGNNNLLIHTGQAEEYLAEGILEETLVHEAAHTSLDDDHAYESEWLAAQAADGEFISSYARDYPYREDVAESFLPYFALKHRSDRISESLAKTIAETIPNRIAYFDSQKFDLAKKESDYGASTANQPTEEDDETFAGMGDDERDGGEYTFIDDETGNEDMFLDDGEEGNEWKDDEDGDFLYDENDEWKSDEDGDLLYDENDEWKSDEDDDFLYDENDEWKSEEDGDLLYDEDGEWKDDEDGDLLYDGDDQEEEWDDETDSYYQIEPPYGNSWEQATDLGGGWRWMDWFGHYFETPIGWIYHYELGWLFRVSENTDSVWFWKQGIGWIWTNSFVYPYLYRGSTSEWIFLRGGGTSQWNLYDFGGGRWLQLGE